MSINHPVSRRFTRLLGAALAASVAAVASADVFVRLDDFNDRNDDGWRHFDQTEKTCSVSTVFDASSGTRC